MIVYKFGGASVRNADAIRNVASILKSCEAEHLVVVQSALGKMTNHLETIWKEWIEGEKTDSSLEHFKNYHLSIAKELKLNDVCLVPLQAMFSDFEKMLQATPPRDSDQAYDQIVSWGELIGTCLVHLALESEGLPIEWVDIRHVLRTDSTHRAAELDWERTRKQTDILKSHFEKGQRNIVLTQGFIAESTFGNTTTLGREGSDYSAAILAYLLDAQSLTIWKDVPGMLNADPKWFNHTVMIPSLSYKEAIELSYYGASVIHPKTIKPLQNKSIPLFVKGFLSPTEKGTEISENAMAEQPVPMYIFKPKQILISISPRDFSFIVESNLRDIFEAFALSGLTINLMQNSAISFSVCVNEDMERISRFIDLMSSNYAIRYNQEVELLTIRHFDENTVRQLAQGKEVLLEQRSRHTLRMVLRKKV
ncbi:MAG: aspartate kinase [Cryomorphaceae bacterium]|nr:aspartate kinase [Cryomorphaceae bacterium]